MAYEDHIDIDIEPKAVQTRKRSASSTALPPKPKKRYAKRALVWQYFVLKEDDDLHSICKYCRAEIGCDTKSVGTSLMISHIDRCKLFKEYHEREKQQKLSGGDGGNMQVVRGVEEFLWLYVAYVQYTTCTREIDGMYVQEKVALKSMFSVEKKRVSVTTNIWVSPTTSYNYMVVTGHWIDANWRMQKRILSFKGNDKALRVFEDALRLRGLEALVQDGDLMHMRCCAHILNLIVGDGLKKAKTSIAATRIAVNYMRNNFQRLKSFVLRCETGKIARGSLPLDVVTRWSSTYLMLTSAIKLRPAFEKMSAEDKLYCEYFEEEDEKTKTKRIGPPTSTQWDEVQSIRLSKLDVTDGGGNQSDPRDSEQKSTKCDLSCDEDDVMYEGADVIFHKQVRERSNVEGFSELDIYLAEKPELKVVNPLELPYDFLSSGSLIAPNSQFPILSEVAKDVLALHVSSVASESAFSTTG
ncbi:Zinc finger BED-type [Arabidopsis suecica]|uniref:Zinc finger BED-type n=1 Tax=Arabidopsis suecica TaxID=45249 RepID=A0A8T1YMZ4_ARASU|nr:Zinc finger BED-type [Arabidopsis suecica]